MALPIIALGLAAGIGAAGSLYGTYNQSRVMQGEAAHRRRMAAYMRERAAVERRNAAMHREAARQEAKQELHNQRSRTRAMRDANRRRRAAIESGSAKSGLSLVGSPSAVLADQARADETNLRNSDIASAQRQLLTLWQGDVSYLRALNEANMTEWQGAVFETEAYNLRAGASNLKRGMVIQAVGAALSIGAPFMGGATMGAVMGVAGAGADEIGAQYTGQPAVSPGLKGELFQSGLERLFGRERKRSDFPGAEIDPS